WFAGKFRALQRMTRSPEGLVKLLKRGFLSLLIIFFAGLAWFYLHRKLYARIAFGFPVRLLFNSVIGVTGILLLLQAWGMDPAALIMSPFGRGVAGSVLTVAAILIAGLAVWEVVNAYITKRANALDASSDSERRAQTLFPLLRNIARVVIIVVCTLIILPELGINIAPLVAGAGIAGIAIGFGAQTLVKDLINGFLILVENAINIGDWVILGGHDGQVEGMTIRNVRLRDIYGNVSMVPWSSVETVTNQTKSFGYAVVEPGVAYRENIDEVIGVVKQVAAEMRADPAISRDILSDLQILGLIELGDSAVVVRTRFKTTPFKRWFLERDFRRRLKNRFDELGIEIPFPHSTIYFGENKSGTAPPARINIEKDAT
ncbi:MAG TPA: mechanosensitive ion channel domain-containing protein, partial [Desulfosalsimonadaceae bacterium]|nr:mechanosensitive ion channel domain-containing protein [Desulfosalsimonadaceae bacterium]